MKLIKMPSISQFRETIRNISHQARFVGLDEAENPVYDNMKPLPVIKFTGTVKLHGCFEKNSLVTLANGENVPISTITEGTYIISYNHNTQENEFKKVVKVINQKLNKEWCKLIFDKTEIICTKDHKIWTENRGYIEAQYLKDNDIFKTI